MKFTRRKKAEAPYCPNCLHLLEGADNVGGWLSAKIYVCPNCNYRGSFYVTKDSDEDNHDDEKTPSDEDTA